MSTEHIRTMQFGLIGTARISSIHDGPVPEFRLELFSQSTGSRVIVVEIGSDELCRLLADGRGLCMYRLGLADNSREEPPA